MENTKILKIIEQMSEKRGETGKRNQGKGQRKGGQIGRGTFNQTVREDTLTSHPSTVICQDAIFSRHSMRRFLSLTSNATSLMASSAPFTLL